MGRRREAKRIGLGIVGTGRMGVFRGEIAARHPLVDWIGVAEIKPDRLKNASQRIGADYATGDFRELINRPEITALIVATEEHLHVESVMAGVERGIPMLIEKPLATNLADSARVLKAIEKAKVDAVVGYTQRFRRRWLAAKEKSRNGSLGDVTLVTTRVLMNRLVALDCYKRTDDPGSVSPMVISGTHALDIVMWMLEAKTPAEAIAVSTNKALGPICKGIDSTVGMITFTDGTIYHLGINWALPITWPGAVYSLDVSIVGTEGVLTIDDTHRDMVMAVTRGQSEGYAPDERRLVDFLGSYPPGDWALDELRGPFREETVSFLDRVGMGVPTPATTAAEAHKNLMLTKALDLSAKRGGKAVKLPLTLEDEARG